jgi:hypothetical protein
LIATARPEVIIIGDVHARSLMDGCEALGVPAGLLWESEIHWHAGRVNFDAVLGISMHDNKSLLAQAERIRDRLGGRPVPNPEVPIIVSAGFHLGQLVSELVSPRHVTSRDEFEADSEALSISEDFLRGYVDYHRETQLQVLRQLARRAPLTVVAPPFKRKTTATAWAAYRAICDLMREARLDLYEPMADLGEIGEGLDESYFGPDGKHGTAEYGRIVIENLIERGALRKKVALYVIR